MPSRNYYSFSSSVRRRASQHGVDGIFAWTIFIFLLMGFTLFCWMGSFYVFGHPEKAANYHLLKRLHKLEEPQRFQITAAPRGEFLKPGQLLERFGSLTPEEIQRTNESLLRNFLRNYHQTRELVPYAVGTYKVMDSFPLTEKKFFHPGVVALLQAVEQPEILLEQVFTTDPNNFPALQQLLTTGEEIKLEKPLDLSAIIFIDHLQDRRIKFTTLPLLYGTYSSKQGSASFTLEPPSDLNMEAGLPLLNAKEVALAEQHYAPYRNKNLPSQLVTKTVSQNNPQTVPRATAVTTEPVIARAVPLNPLPALPATAVIPKTNTTAAMSLQKTNAVSTAVPIPTPVATPTVVTPPAATTKIVTTPPSLTNAPTPATAVTNLSGGIWPLYDPGKMPRGRLVDVTELPTLAEQGLAGERLYLQGNFSVTASGQDRAVLRYQSAATGLPIGRTGKIRIITAYPAGMIPPAEGTSLLRDHQHPFMITEVKKESDGTINLYVREITNP